MITTKEVIVENVVAIEERPLTVTVNVMDGTMGKARITFNGRGEIFSLPVEDLAKLIGVLSETEDECKKVSSLYCAKR